MNEWMTCMMMLISSNSSNIYFNLLLQDKMEQLKMCQKMDGTIITYPKLTAEWLKIPPQITVEGRPKRQRPTHLGVRDDEEE
jgi:hypothetical protein